MYRLLPLAALLPLIPTGCDRSIDYGARDTAGASAADTSGGDDSSGDEGAGGSADGGAANDTGGRGTGAAYVAGQVLGPDGAPAEGLFVTLCSGGCRYDDTDEEGRFSFEDVDSADYAIHIADITRELGWAEALVLTHIGEGEVLELDTPFVMPELGPATPLDGQPAAEVEVVDGLWLTVDPASVELPFGTEALDLAGAELDTFPPLLPVEDALAVWYLAPFEAHSSVPITVRVENRWGLAPGETLTLYEASYLDFAWLQAGQLTVSEDGSELVGGALSVLSTLVLAPGDGSASENTDAPTVEAWLCAEDTM